VVREEGREKSPYSISSRAFSDIRNEICEEEREETSRSKEKHLHI
jgi:hypothetical protein